MLKAKPHGDVAQKCNPPEPSKQQPIARSLWIIHGIPRPRQPRETEGKEGKAGEKKEEGKGRMKREDRRKEGWERKEKARKKGGGREGGGNMLESVKLLKGGTHIGPGIMDVVPTEESAAFGATS